MSFKEEIKEEIDKLPENILTEVFDFILLVALKELLTNINSGVIWQRLKQRRLKNLRK